MSHYLVHVRRTENITFAVEADNEEDAERRYLADGDEVASSTHSIEVESVESDRLGEILKENA